MKKLLSIFLLFAFCMIAFSPPSYSSPPEKQVTSFVIDLPAIQTVCVQSNDITYVYFEQTKTLQKTELMQVCGFARSWPLISNLVNYTFLTSWCTDYNMRTCLNSTNLLDVAKIKIRYDNRQPRDGLNMAAA
ncbi:MAG: hypothetical protein ACOYN4_04830 [Bacteroidales bacterium]